MIDDHHRWRPAGDSRRRESVAPAAGLPGEFVVVVDRPGAAVGSQAHRGAYLLGGRCQIWTWKPLLFRTNGSRKIEPVPR